MRINRAWNHIFFYLMIAWTVTFVSLTGCSSAGKQSDFVLYYINSEETALQEVSYQPKGDGTDEITELLQVLSDPSSDLYLAPLDGITCRIQRWEDGLLELDFSMDYRLFSGIRGTLTRAAVVKTLLQIEGVDGVSFFVGGEPLTDSSGGLIGTMDEGSFVDYFGKEQGNLLSENLVLYYANDDGTRLIREVRRVYFDSTMSMEQAVLAALTEAPDVAGAQIPISPSANIINVTTTDGICYVDLDASFVQEANGITRDVSIYAVVNSLCELDGIGGVQLNIIGEDAAAVPEGQSMSGQYEKNTDLVINP